MLALGVRELHARLDVELYNLRDGECKFELEIRDRRRGRNDGANFTHGKWRANGRAIDLVVDGVGRPWKGGRLAPPDEQYYSKANGHQNIFAEAAHPCWANKGNPSVEVDAFARLSGTPIAKR